eukprot:jgi/Chrzof1/2185/Cz11g05110.t1
MTKALHICRHLARSGWRVVLIETQKYWHVGARFSNCVHKFVTVPVPEDDPVGYLSAIKDTAVAEGATLFIPTSSPIASIYDALVVDVVPTSCRCVTLPADVTARLDNKASFSQYAKELGLLVPKWYHITSPKQLIELNSQPQVFEGSSFVLKNLSYDSVHRTDLFTVPCSPAALIAYISKPDITISDSQPWILQQFIKGPEYSCFTIAHEGRVVAHADTTASLSNLNYAYKGVPDIRDWVTTFCNKTAISGQVCLDFIQSQADGRFYCIECNPRTSSIITEYHDHPGLAAAYTAPATVQKTVIPLQSTKPTYWYWNEFARLVTTGNLKAFIETVASGVDAIFDPLDPLPFLGLHYLQIPVLLVGNMFRGNPWKKIDLCIGKITELYGD